MLVQRRLAAILAADVAGYSRLMGEDETGTLERLKALRQDALDLQISVYGGRIVKTTGDGARSNQNSSTYRSTLQNARRSSQMMIHGMTNWSYFGVFRELNLVQVHWEV